MASKRRGRLWLVVAVAMIGLAAWLALSGEAPAGTEKPDIYLPRRATAAETEKIKERRTIAEPLPTVLPDASVVMPKKSLRPLDPVLAALPSKFEKGAVVIEANALRHSDLGELMIDCLFAGDKARSFLADSADAGIDPINGIDRMAMVDNSLMISGDFSRVSPSRFTAKGEATKWGADTLLWDEDDGTGVMGLWKQQMFFFAPTLEEARKISDRLDGRIEQDVAPALTEANAYGEIYGKMNPETIAKLVEADNPQLSQLIRVAASNVELHVDASHDVGVVADIGGSMPEQTDELRKALGVALSLARLKAKADGKDREAAMMDLTKVAKADQKGRFRLEMGLPYEFLAKEFRECAERRRGDAGTPSLK